EHPARHHGPAAARRRARHPGHPSRASPHGILPCGIARHRPLSERRDAGLTLTDETCGGTAPTCRPLVGSIAAARCRQPTVSPNVHRFVCRYLDGMLDPAALRTLLV